MDCERFPLTCSIDRLTEQVGAFDALGALSTLLATLVGAAVALAGSAWLERQREKREVKREAEREAERRAALYVERFDGLVFRLVEGLADRQLTLTHSTGKPARPTELSALADALRIVAGNGADRNVTKALQRAIDRVGDLERKDQITPTRVIGQILRAWREGSHDAAKAAERFDGLAT